MTFGSLQSFHTTTIKHHDRGLTLVFGSDGQFSLIGGGIPSLPAGAPLTLTASNTAPSELTSASPIPKLDATSASLTGTSSFTPTPTTASVASSLASSGYNSSTVSGTNTNLPSVPTASYPSPSPSAVSDPNDHGVGAPFYLAIVLASISFVGCIAAFVAWWIRSRARKRDLELEDPWHRRDTLSDPNSPLNNDFEKGVHTDLETQKRPYYLPASLVRRSSSDLLAVPHTIPTLEQGALRSSMPHPALAAEGYSSMRGVNDPFQSSANQNVPSSQTTSLYSRPSTARLETGLSVQESTRTLGRLRIANRVPGDVTSGDEGGINIRRLQSGAGPSLATNTGAPASSMDDSTIQTANFDRSNRPVEGHDAPLEPPGPATFPWGRRTDAIAALRRTRRRTPETTVRTYKNPRYGGYLYPTPDGGPSSTTWQASDAINEEEDEKKLPDDPPSEPSGWTNSLKSSFWQAVDAMAGNRPTGAELASVGGGSRFTPVPQRVTSRRSPVSPTHLPTGSSLPDLPNALSQDAETRYELSPPEKSAVTPDTHENSTCSRSGSSSTQPSESEVPRVGKYAVGRPGSHPPRVSRLNQDLSAGTHRHPESLKADTGSVYSTDSTVARANLRKYGYGDPIPSSWSALGARRDSQLDLARMYLPLPPPIRNSSPSPLSITPSLLTLESSVGSSVVSTSIRTRTPVHSSGDVTGSDVSTLRSAKNAHANSSSDAETRTISTYTMSRNGTIDSGRSTIGHEAGIVPLPSSSSTTSSMLNRKKGVATRRKRPRPPLRAPSTASSVQSIESGLSIREVAVKRALLERRKKVRAAENLKGREDSLVMHSRDASIRSSLG